MDNLLDFIFDNLDIDSLDRAKVLEYLNYLTEIDRQHPTVKEQVKFQKIKLLLDKRLVELDKQLIRDYSRKGLLLLNTNKPSEDSPL